MEILQVSIVVYVPMQFQIVRLVALEQSVLVVPIHFILTLYLNVCKIVHQDGIK